MRYKVKELVERHKDKPVEWWARQLAYARENCGDAKEMYRRRCFSQIDTGIRVGDLEAINERMNRFLRKAGFGVTTLRITHDVSHCEYNENLTREQIEYDDEYCWRSGSECDDCDNLKLCREVVTVRAYEYQIVDAGVITTNTDFSMFESGYALIKVEDITNPKQPIVLWERGKEQE